MPAYYLEIVVVALGLILLLLDAFVPGKNKSWIGGVGILGLLIVFFMNFSARGGEGGFWNYYTYGPGTFAGFYKGIALAATIIVLIMSLDYQSLIKKFTADNYAAGEFFALPLFTCAGLMWMASATDLITIFVSLELVTISFYVLVAFTRRNLGSLEAGVKYLILGALSTGFLVYGITWLFGSTGSTSLAVIGEVLKAAPEMGNDGVIVQDHGVSRMAVLFSFALLIIGLGFKIGSAPFHIWIPDVYQGAPTPVTAFLSVASKAAGFIVLLRVMAPFLGAELTAEPVIWILSIMAALTLILGNLSAIPQTNFKRLLAYSSIAHAGFLVMAIACTPVKQTNDLAVANVVSFYLAAYLIMTMLAFLVMSLVRVQLGSDDLKAYDGLAKRSPFLAFALLIAMASLAGIPLTAGFFGKAFVFWLGVQADAWWLIGIAIVGAAAGFYYYLKVVKAMYFNAPEGVAADETPEPLKVPGLTRLVIVVLIILTILFGVNPQGLLNVEVPEVVAEQAADAQ